MLTPWGETLDRRAPLPEYPRPQLVRENYVNLNGLWDYAITASDAPPGAWDGQIVVPFSPEAPLSGVERQLRPGQVLWYRRALPLAREQGRRVLLHFGAVDQRAWVYVNGLLAGTHTGGYTAFTIDITSLLREENTLLVAVRDDTEASPLARGKQKTERGGIWYTPQSGIWQTVWAESVPENYVQSVLFTPELPSGRVSWRLRAPQPQGAKIAVFYDGAPVCEGSTDADGCGSAVIEPQQLHLWSPESAALYDVEITLGDDCVKSYFAMRTVAAGTDTQGRPCLLLNGEPIFQHGVLDQGYWPDGLYTAPSDEALVYDIQLMKQLGFNLLRKHIKIEPMRWYYHCDRLGMLVWQDMPSGGGAYRALTISAPLVTGVHLRDAHYRLFAREDAEGRESFRCELTQMIEQLQNCPCIVLWVPFNEGWGQFDAKDVTRLVRRLDPTRLVDHASGWHDQRVSDVKSWHVYFMPYRFKPDRAGRAVVLSEFGGYHLPVDGHTWTDKSFGYRGYRTPQALMQAIDELYRKQIIPARQKGLAAAVYTQLSDVEDELNGFVSYDRRVVKVPVAQMQALARALDTL